MKLSRLGAVSIGLVIGSTLAGGLLGKSALAGGGRLNEQLHLYTAMLGAIEREYVEEVPSDRLVSGSIRELLRTLDPHSNFFEQRDYQTMQERQKGQYYGLGITVVRSTATSPSWPPSRARRRTVWGSARATSSAGSRPRTRAA